MKGYYQFTLLQQEPRLIHGIFDRSFGNISLFHGQKQAVERNKEKIAQALGIDKKNFYSVKQTHSNRLQVITNKKGLRGAESEADGLITNQKGIFLTIKTADCFPVLFYDRRQEVVAAIHVGWRGAMAKIFLNALLKLMVEFKSQPKDLLVGIGPGIGEKCFQHQHLLQEKLTEWRKYIKIDEDGWRRLALARFIKDQLISLGVREENLEEMGICTCCSRCFFSHFRSLQTGEKEGRFASVIGLKEKE